MRIHTGTQQSEPLALDQRRQGAALHPRRLACVDAGEITCSPETLKGGDCRWQTLVCQHWDQ